MLTFPPPECDAFQSLSTDQQTHVVDLASTIVWTATGRVYGTERVTVRPVQQCATSRPTGIRTGWGGNLFALAELTGACNCNRMIRLGAPVQTIDQLTVNGAVVPATSYRLVDNEYLLVTDPLLVVPRHQSLALDVTQPGTYAVTYTRGRPVPLSGQLALQELACELAKAVACDSSCSLPNRIQSITREGISVEVVQPSEYLSQGFTGIAGVDQWIRAVNPAGLVESMDVWSPDMPVLHQIAPVIQ